MHCSAPTNRRCLFSTWLNTLFLFAVHVICIFGIVFKHHLVIVYAEEKDFATDFVADPVTEALDYVEAIEKQRHNCSFRPTLNLQYSKNKWRKEANIPESTANLLSLLFRTGTHILGSHPDDSNMLYSLVRVNVDNYDNVFGSAIAFDTNLYENYSIFCPYAFISQRDGTVTSKDLSIGYDYHNNMTEWFWIPYKQWYNYSYEVPNLHSPSTDSYSHRILTVKDGYWTRPYFDCGGGDVWMVTFSMPFFTNAHSFDTSRRNFSRKPEYIFAGVTTIDLVLDNIDIYQCPLITGTVNDDNIFDPFINTHKCPNTTECLHIPNQGFKRGTYKCMCLSGYYFPYRSKEPKYFSGTEVENEHSKLIRGLPNQYQSFRCLPCTSGCDDCVDNSPCVMEPNNGMRLVLSLVQCFFIACLILLAGYIFVMRENRVIKAASPGLLYVFIFGAGMLYCQILVDGLLTVRVSCILIPWFKYVGFSLTYGALLFKTWRTTVVFKVRSAKPIRFSDQNLYLRIAVLVVVVVVYLGAWMLLSMPQTVTLYTTSRMKYIHCSSTFWIHIGQAGQLILLAWGVYVCVKVRKAPSPFNEAIFISISICNSTMIALLSFAFNFIVEKNFVFLPEDFWEQFAVDPTKSAYTTRGHSILPTFNGGADLMFIAEFCGVHVSITVMVILIFGSKLYHIITHNDGDDKNVNVYASDKQPVNDVGAVYAVDVKAPSVNYGLSYQEVKAEVGKMKEILQEIADAMQLDGAGVSTPQMPKRTEINKGYSPKDGSIASLSSSPSLPRNTNPTILEKDSVEPENSSV